jgi:HSP20 family protein
MTKLIEQLKQGADQAWESLTEGWREVASRTSSALTRFLPSAESDAGGSSASDALAMGTWAFMAADVVDSGEKLIVRLEAPGMKRDDFIVELRGKVLSISGEKRVDKETKHGRYRVTQCAYGRFQREVVLPSEVKRGECSATYRDGVLRIELAKSHETRHRSIAVNAG